MRIDIFDLLLFAFLAMLVGKVFGLLNWSWWVVTSPLWLPLLVGIGIVLIVATAFAIAIGVRAITEAMSR